MFENTLIVIMHLLSVMTLFLCIVGDVNHCQQVETRLFNYTYSCILSLRGARSWRTYPVESDGGSDGQASDTGVVPSEETSSCVNR